MTTIVVHKTNEQGAALRIWRCIYSLLCLLMMLLGQSPLLAAQTNANQLTHSNKTTIQQDVLIDDSFRLELDTKFTDSIEFSDLNMSIELPAELVGSRIFDLDTSQMNCLMGEKSCKSEVAKLDMRYSKSLTASIDKGLDIQLRPRASVSFDNGTSSTLVGALLRVGDDLKDGEELRSNRWYMFAGADAEAVTYAPNNLRDIGMGDFHLQDRIIVGDAQAGVGYRIGDNADISLGYFRREVTSFGNEMHTDRDSYNYSEDAAAISFTWRR